MATLVWSHRLFIGVETLDEQHESMLALGRELRRLLTTSAPRAPTLEVFDQLIRQTRFHFAVEESLMRFFAYSRHEAHQALHARILARAEEMRAQFAAGERFAAWGAAKFIDEWVLAHIAQSDSKYAHTMR